MNTLEKISKLESKMGAVEQLVSNLASLPTAMGNVNETVARLAANQKHNAERTNQIFSAVGEKQDHVVQRIMAIEQSFAALAKTLNAVVSELEESKAINSNSVMRRIRLADEAAEKVRMETMVKFGALQASELVSATSLLVVSQSLESADGKTGETIADYRVYELTSPLNEKELVDQFVNKKAGETVIIAQENGTVLKTTILEVYEHTQMGDEVQDAPNQVSSEG